VPARIPLDVDLEDRVIYGLSPQRLGYAALAVLAAMAAWHALPGLAGPAAAVLTALLGAALAWGRWAGRGLDAWALAIARYGLRTYRIELDSSALSRLSGMRRRPRLARAPRQLDSEWRPRLARTTQPTPSLRVVGGWDPDP
jgi:hypothetical protein